MTEHSLFTDAVLRAAETRRLNSWEAFGVLDDAYQAAVGAQVVARLLTRNQDAQSSGDAEILSGYESAALLSLVNTAMGSLIERIEDVATSAEKQVREGA